MRLTTLEECLTARANGGAWFASKILEEPILVRNIHNNTLIFRWLTANHNAMAIFDNYWEARAWMKQHAVEDRR